MILAKRPRSDPEERYYADLRQMSRSQIPKRIRQKGTNTLSGTWDGTGRISQSYQTTQAELERSLNLKAILTHGCSLHLKNPDREPKLRILLNQRPVTISKSISGCESTVRNLQHPPKSRESKNYLEPSFVPNPKLVGTSKMYIVYLMHK